MADDKPGGDDLFEDLDKFFAPIRDVDWESEETPVTSDTAQEEHVAVRPSDTDPIVISEEPETTVPPASSAVDDEDDEDAWYDTCVLEPIDELMGEAIEDEDIDALVAPDVGSDVEGPVDPADQGGLFDVPEASDEGSVEDDETPSGPKWWPSEWGPDDERGAANRLTPKKELDAKSLTVLDFAPAVDQNGFVVTKATADKYKLTKLSDVPAVGNQLVLGGPAECPARPFCAAGLKSTYGISFKDFKPLDTGGPLTVAALKGGQIDIGLLFTSDSTIATNGFVLLEDDKHLQLSDNVAPIVRNDLLSKAPSDFKSLINSIAPKLTTAELTALNKQADVDKTDPKDIAKAWLKKQGLIK